MKKLSLVLVLILTLAFTSCKGKENSRDDVTDTIASSKAKTTTVAAIEEQTTEKPKQTTVRGTENTTEETTTPSSEDDLEATENKTSDGNASEFVGWVTSQKVSFDLYGDMEMDGASYQYSAKLAMNNGSLYMKTSTQVMGEDVEAIIIFKDNWLYTLMPALKTGIKMNGEGVDLTQETGGLSADLKLLESGKETVDGESCDFEKYDAGNGEISIFYFLNGNIYALGSEKSGQKQILYIKNATSSVDKSLFEIPADYQITELGN